MAVPMAVAALLTYTGHSLTWYCRPYLLLALYAAPSMFGVGFVHFLARRSLVSKVHVQVVLKTVEAPVSGHPWEAENVSGAGRLQECVNPEFVWARVQTGLCQGGHK